MASKKKRTAPKPAPETSHPVPANQPAEPPPPSEPKPSAATTPTLAAKAPRRHFPLAFKLILPLFPLVVLLLLELTLRLAGFGARVSLFLRDKAGDGAPIYRLNPRAAERFFFRRAGGQAVAPSRALPVEFPVRKPAGTFRIFALGESTTAGFPYPRSAAFSGYLREMLGDLHRDKKFEVINCGLTALNSYAVVDFMPEVLRCDPDLIVVYCAHNEFYGAHGVGSLEAITANRTLIRAFIALQKTCLFQGLEALVAWLRPKGEAKSVTALIEVMARDQEIRRHSRKHAIAEASFRANLAAIIARAQRAGVPIVITTVVSNEKDLSPLRSAHGADLSPGDLERWTDLFNKGYLAQQAGRFDLAASLYPQALRIDPEFAEGWFRLGLCQARLSQWNQARESFRNALEYDVLHFRACPVFNDIIRDVTTRAAQTQSPALLVDLEPAFAQESPGGVVGYELMTDHLHPNMRGTFLIARAICEALAQSPLAARFGPSWDFARLRSFEQYQTAVGFSPVERYLTADILLSLYQNFPFESQLDHPARLTKLSDEASSCLAALTPEERARIGQWTGKRYTFPLHMELAETYLGQGDYTRAAAAYREALRQAGEARAQDAQPAWVGLGFAERKRGNFDEALRAYEQALKLPGDQAAVWYNLARLHLDRNDPVRAQQAFTKVLELKPNDPDTLINLGLLARDRGDAEAARRFFEQAAKTAGGNAPAQFHLAALALKAGQSDAALAHLRDALAADPKHVEALRLLGFCHLQRREYEQAESALARALELDDSDATTWYNRACAAVARSQPDAAFEFLKRAAALGGETLRKDLEADPAFTELRSDPRFRALMQPAK